MSTVALGSDFLIYFLYVKYLAIRETVWGKATGICMSPYCMFY